MSRLDEALNLLLDRLTSVDRAVLRPLAEALLRPLTPRGPEPTRHRGVPDGLSGLGRRGPWDRLVPSTWALLDVAPDELLRRAVDGELQYWELAEEDPRPSKRIVVRLDAGPAMWGAPRLVQAAALLALAAHAAVTGSALIWGPLPPVGPDAEAPPGQPEVEGLPQGWMKLFREMRAWTLPRVDGLSRADLGAHPSDTLVVIGPRLTLSGATQLTLEATLEGVEARLDGRPLPLPALTPNASRALRPQVEEKQASFAETRDAVSQRATVRGLPTVPLAPGFVFSASGARLLGLTACGTIAWAIPIGATGDRRVHQATVNQEMLALGWIDQGLATVGFASPTSVEISLRRRHSALVAHVARSDMKKGAPLRSIARRRTGLVVGRGRPSVLHPATGWDTEPPDGWILPDPATDNLADPDAGVQTTQRRVGTSPLGKEWLAHPSVVPWKVYSALDGRTLGEERLPASGETRVGVLRERLLSVTRPGPGQPWQPVNRTILSRSTALDQLVGELGGFVHDPLGRPAAVIWRPDQVVRVGVDGTEHLLNPTTSASTAEIVDVLTSPTGDAVAWLDRDGRLTVVHARTAALLLHAGPR